VDQAGAAQKGHGITVAFLSEKQSIDPGNGGPLRWKLHQGGKSAKVNSFSLMNPFRHSHIHIQTP
jgi:hypothetical protein